VHTAEFTLARLAVNLDLFLPPQPQPTFKSLVIDETVEQFGSLRDQSSFTQSVVGLDR
jgi:hypothetical protein